MTKGLVAGFIFNLFLVMSVPASSTSAASALAADSAVSLQERPVMKVVRLLEDTSAELKKELEDDEKTHEALTCWCNSNNEEKKAAIAAGAATSKQL
mmetsp:Transcript_118086/g.214746  ORF Transcript_118086/g.214746 Transcript_118086/m.214746 type:complete len:97 (-) Transcript_118086:10-300(-)